MPLHKDPKKQFLLDQRAQSKIQEEARKGFRKVLSEVLPEVRKLREEIPGKDEKSVALRKKTLLKIISESQPVRDFLAENFPGPGQESFQKRTLNLLRDIAIGDKPLLEGLDSLDLISGGSFQTRELEKSREPLGKIPPEIRAFLPKNLVVEVDPEGKIQRVTERFGNESRTIEVKINKMKLIVKNYNKIVRQVKRDLVSQDEIRRMCAIVTSIIMETGIRPGDVGNAATIRAGGEKIVVETFGATTLGPDHIEFVRENFAKIEFVGKKGTLNTAFLESSDIIAILKDLVQKARTGGFKYIFTTSSGDQFDYSDLAAYFKENFADIDPTDFRKLRAAETIFSELSKSQEALYEKIRSFASLEEKILRERVLEAVRDTLGEAIEASRAALSHKSQSETIDSYLDPRITLQFLSRGSMAQTLHDAILDNDLVVSFDPMKFVDIAMAKKVAKIWLRRASGKTTLRDLLEKLSEEIQIA